MRAVDRLPAEESYMRFALHGHTILEDGHPVAEVTSRETDEGARLVGLLNLADRDEQLLDDLVERISARNDAPPPA